MVHNKCVISVKQTTNEVNYAKCYNKHNTFGDIYTVIECVSYSRKKIRSHHNPMLIY